MSTSKYKVEYETKDGWIISSTHFYEKLDINY